MEVGVPPAVRVTGVGANEKVMPVAAGETVADSATLPAKLFRLVRVMVDVAEPPAVKLAGLAAPADIEKSWKMKVRVVELVVEPLVPVTVSV